MQKKSDSFWEVAVKIDCATEQLNKALDMMNNAVAGGQSQPGARECRIPCFN